MIGPTWGQTWGRSWGNTWGRTLVFHVPQIYGADALPRRSRRRVPKESIIDIAQELALEVPLSVVRKLDRVVHSTDEKIKQVFVRADPILMGKILQVAHVWQRRHRKRQQQTFLLLM